MKRHAKVTLPRLGMAQERYPPITIEVPVEAVEAIVSEVAARVMAALAEQTDLETGGRNAAVGLTGAVAGRCSPICTRGVYRNPLRPGVERRDRPFARGPPCGPGEQDNRTAKTTGRKRHDLQH